MTLYICEKPSQARDIAAVLGADTRHDGYFEGSDCKVTWCLGHLLELAPPDDYCENLKPWRMSVLPVIPDNWRLHPKEKTKSQLRIIGVLLKKTHHVVVATDADREGDVIGRQLLDYFKYDGKVERLWLSALDEASIKKALSSILPGESTYPLYQAGLARQRADWLVGMNLTMATSHLYGSQGQGVLSVGRVQTPTLALVVQRDKVIENFQAKDYYELMITCQTSSDIKFNVKWDTPESVKDEAGHCLKSDVIDAVIKKIDGQKACVTVFSDQPKKASAPLCFSLSGLQKLCSSRFGLPAKKTLEIAQSLYEKHKATTYPRTDSGYLPTSQFSEASGILKAVVTIDSELASLVEVCDAKLKSPVWNDKKVTAHHGIIPTSNSAVSLESMNDEERRVYDLIRRYYIAQFLGEYQYTQRKVTVQCIDENFSAQNSAPLKPGWKRAINQQLLDDDKEEAAEIPLPNLAVDEMVSVVDCDGLTKKTKPPARFTEGTLISAMKNIAKYVEGSKFKKTLRETSGIGTEATRADMIEKLLFREYLLRDKKHLISTERGRSLIRIVPAQMAAPISTAIWEQRLDDIAKGEGTLDDFIDDQVMVLEEMIEDEETLSKEIKNPFQTGEKIPCPKCQAALLRRKGKNGYFWGCSRYPDCHVIMSDNQGKPQAREAAVASDIDCPVCNNGKLVKRKGKKAYWWGCNQFPKCKSMYFDQEGTPNFTTTQNNKGSKSKSSKATKRIDAPTEIN